MLRSVDGSPGKNNLLPPINTIFKYKFTSKKTINTSKYHSNALVGRLTDRQMELLKDNPLFVGVKLPHYEELETLDKRFPDVEAQQVSLAKLLH